MVKTDETEAERLQRILLSWDYWDLLSKSEEGSGPNAILEKVPPKFRDVQHYLDVFAPLVLEECAAQLLNGNTEEGSGAVPQAAVAAAVETQDQYHYARLTVAEGVSSEFAKNDVIIVSKDKLDETGMDKLHALGFVEGHEGESSLRVRMHITDDSQAGNSGGLERVKRMRDTLQPGSCWWVIKCANMGTVQREWVALHGVTKVPFRHSLVTAEPIQATNKSYAIPGPMATELNQQYNESQMRAISAGLEGDAVVLIQGPPGTGKTSTILGLLSIIMHSAPKGSFRLEMGTGSHAVALSLDERMGLWRDASPWLSGSPNPRDEILPDSSAGTRPNADDIFKRQQQQQAALLHCTAPRADVFGLLPGTVPLVVGRAAAMKAHVLVCAPSNSALDEIVMRVMNAGLMDEKGRSYFPSIVRCGVARNMHHSVASVSLEALVETRLGAKAGGQGGKRSWVEMERMRQAILDEADIVCSTLSFAGSGVFARMSRPFDVVVVDEAAQAVEPSTLVPLTLGAKQVYMVGDPIQLPATVISTRAVDLGYDISMFKRLQGAGYPVQMLDTQYRMHPRISEFPSREFYGGGLKDAPNMANKCSAPWHKYPAFGPLTVFDVPGKEAAPESGASIENRVEAELVLLLVRELRRLYPDLRSRAAVAVISPYKAQVRLLRSKFKEALGEEGAKLVDINTIDGFQGREKDIAIFSTVRSSRRSVGFVADERRINVGLTRARCSLIVLGNCKALEKDTRWGNLIAHARDTRCLYRASKPFPAFLSSVLEGSTGPVAALPDVDVTDAPQAEEGAEDADCYSEEEEVPVPKAGGRRRGGRAAVPRKRGKK